MAGEKSQDREALETQLVTLEATFDEAREETNPPGYLESLRKQISATRSALERDKN